MIVIIVNIEKLPKQARPVLQADEGDVNLVNVNNGIERLKLKGMCSVSKRSNYV